MDIYNKSQRSEGESPTLNSEDNYEIEKKFRAEEGKFYIALDRFRHHANWSQSTEEHKCGRNIEIHYAEKAVQGSCSSIPPGHFRYPPGSLIDRIATRYRELRGRRDKHFEAAWERWRRGREIEEENRNVVYPDFRPTSVAIGANLKSARHRGVGTICSGGAYPHKLSIPFSLNVGLGAASAVHHFRSYCGKELFSIELFTKFDQMEWLHRELIGRPKSRLVVSFQLKAHRHRGEPEPKDREIFYLKRNLSAPISDLSLCVTDRLGRSSTLGYDLFAI